MKTFLVLVFCVSSIYAQSFAGVRPFGFNAYLQEINSRKQLSPQQQGHILSDIQQHQNRFQQINQPLQQNLILQNNQIPRHKDIDVVRNNAQLQQPQFQPSFIQNTQFNNVDFINNKQNFIDQTQNQNILRQNQLNTIPQNNFRSNNNNDDIRNQKIVQRPQFKDNSFENNFGRQLPVTVQDGQNQLPPFSRLEQPQQPVISPFNNQPIINSAQQLLNNPAISTNFNGNAPFPTISSLPQNTRFNTPTTQRNVQPGPIIPQIRTTAPPLPTPSIVVDPVLQKELELKKQIIEKHNQFVEKQYEKALKKAQTDHQEWVSKQREFRTIIYQTLATIDDPKKYNSTRHRSRYINPDEVPAFQKALENYWIEHPTTTTTTTTEATTTTLTPRNIFEKFKQQLQQVKEVEKNDEPTLKISGIKSTTENNLEELLGESTKDYGNNNNLLKFLPTAIPSTKTIPLEILKHAQKVSAQKNDLLRQPKIILTENPDLDFTKNLTSREIVYVNADNFTLPNNLIGTSPFTTLKLDNETLEQFILQSSTTVKPPKIILEELTKNVLPPGADFEVIKHDQNGGLQEVGKLPPNLASQKKVTFVLLEEQPDGSFKVQGVKGNTENAKESVNVDSILKRIKNGEIKLPQSKSTTPEVQHQEPLETQSTRSVTPSYKNFISKVETKKPKEILTTPPPTKPTFFPFQASTQAIFSSIQTQPPFSPTLRPVSTNFPTTSQERVRFSSTFTYPTTSRPTTQTVFNVTNRFQQVNNLIDVLKKNELYAMAKFLKQSGLDTILNETGPYSIFVPTDKAFRLMLIQLGGPQKAEEKFKDNPRLLSGLLLHHIIPGTFEINQLQDEMTGVSLAGTQLRVNQYTLQDVEWNEVKVTTINGAKVVAEKQDIPIPQGIVHAIDRVMFPLPVGDIIQTLQSDREKRFTNFLKIYHLADVSEMLQEGKTFTLFVPVDRAFSKMNRDELEKLQTEKKLARKFILKHLVPGTMYTSGMSYYQIYDSLLPEQQVTINKDSDRIKVNNNAVLTQNIPATNGVIHIINGIL